MWRRLLTIGLAIVAAVVLSAAVAVAGSMLNTIDDEATIVGAGHQAQVTVLIGCPEGERVRFHVTVTDTDGTVGTGQGAARCTGLDGRDAHQVTVAATRGQVFDPGTAHAEAWATTGHGQQAHRHTWTEQISLVE